MVMFCALESYRLPANFPSRELDPTTMHSGGGVAMGIVVEGSVIESAPTVTGGISMGRRSKIRMISI